MVDDVDTWLFLVEVTVIGIVLRDEIAYFVILTSDRGDVYIEVAFISVVVVGSVGAIVVETDDVAIDVGGAAAKGIDDVDNE